MPLAKMMENGLRREHALILLIAALQGAAGVTLAAVAAHLDASANLATASQFLMVHACAGLALAALAGALSTPPRGLIYATFALQAGVTLFSADLALRALWPRKALSLRRPNRRNHDDFELGRPRGLGDDPPREDGPRFAWLNWAVKALARRRLLAPIH